MVCPGAPHPGAQGGCGTLPAPVGIDLETEILKRYVR